MRLDLVQIMEDRGHRPAFAVPVLDELKQILAGSPIDRSEGLVEQDQLGILNDQPSKKNALELASGERFDRPPFEPFETNRGECLAPPRASFGSRPWPSRSAANARAPRYRAQRSETVSRSRRAAAGKQFRRVRKRPVR
jgi:hypothetical protein